MQQCKQNKKKYIYSPQKGSTLWTHQEAREGKYNCHSCEGKRGDTHHILTECRTTRASRDALRDQVEELLTRWMKPNLPEESTIKTHWRELAWERAPARLTSLQWMIMAGNHDSTKNIAPTTGDVWFLGVIPLELTKFFRQHIIGEAGERVKQEEVWGELFNLIFAYVVDANALYRRNFKEWQRQECITERRPSQALLLQDGRTSRRQPRATMGVNRRLCQSRICAEEVTNGLRQEPRRTRTSATQQCNRCYYHIRNENKRDQCLQIIRTHRRIRELQQTERRWRRDNFKTHYRRLSIGERYQW